MAPVSFRMHLLCNCWSAVLFKTSRYDRDLECGSLKNLLRKDFFFKKMTAFQCTADRFVQWQCRNVCAIIEFGSTYIVLFSFIDMTIKQSCLHMESLQTKEIRINHFFGLPIDPSNHCSEKNNAIFYSGMLSGRKERLWKTVKCA